MFNLVGANIAPTFLFNMNINMKRIPLDVRESMPPAMKKYIDNYGWHFNKLAYYYAVEFMYKHNDKTDRDEKVKYFSKEDVDTILKEYNIELKNKIMYDYVYVATMCKADYSKSISTKEALAMFVKETVDDVDASDETTFRRWVATMIGNGIPIDWNEIC